MTIVQFSDGEIFTKPEKVGSESTRSHQHSTRFWSASRKRAVNVSDCAFHVRMYCVFNKFCAPFLFFCSSSASTIHSGSSNKQYLINCGEKVTCMWVCRRWCSGFDFLFFLFTPPPNQLCLVLFSNVLYGAAVHVFFWFISFLYFWHAERFFFLWKLFFFFF